MGSYCQHSTAEDSNDEQQQQNSLQLAHHSIKQKQNRQNKYLLEEFDKILRIQSECTMAIQKEMKNFDMKDVFDHLQSEKDTETQKLAPKLCFFDGRDFQHLDDIQSYIVHLSRNKKDQVEMGCLHVDLSKEQITVSGGAGRGAESSTYELEKVSGAQKCIGDDDNFNFNIELGRNDKIEQFSKNLGTLAMKFFHQNNKLQPTIIQVVQGIQKFYLEFQCPKEAAESPVFVRDIKSAYLTLIKHFQISDPEQIITDDLFNDADSPEFRFISFLYQMKPSISGIIIQKMGLQSINFERTSSQEEKILELAGPFLFCLWRIMIYSQISREGLKKEYLNYFEWPLTVFKGFALKSDEIYQLKEIASHQGLYNPVKKKYANSQLQYRFQTLMGPQRASLFYGQALQTAYITARSAPPGGQMKPVVIQLTIKDQIRMAAFRINVQNIQSELHVSHNSKQFSAGEEVFFFEGFKIHIIGVEEVRFAQLNDTVVSIVHAFTENGID